MGRIITINRQFGSGGRELGKRLAEMLGIAYYDSEIITEIATRSGLATEYVNNIVEKKPIVYYPITIGRSFMTQPLQRVDFQSKIFGEQHALITELADKSDCVIIGRCADYILRDRKPLRIFVYADMAGRIARCRRKAPPEEAEMTDKQLARHIEDIDKGRREYYRYFTGQKWEDISHYDLCINTTDFEIKKLAEELVGFLCKQ